MVTFPCDKEQAAAKSGRVFVTNHCKATVTGSKLFHTVCTQSVTVFAPMRKIKRFQAVRVRFLCHLDVEELVLRILDSAKGEFMRFPFTEV